MDVPIETVQEAVNIPDPQNPTGGRGIGEPTQGAMAALASAISDALDGHLFNSAPTTTDMIIDHLAGNDYSTKSLKTILSEVRTMPSHDVMPNMNCTSRCR